MTGDLGGRERAVLDLLPEGVPALARSWGRLGSTLLGRDADGFEAVERDVVLPVAVEPDWPGPAPPQSVPGGWVQADLADDDAEAFAVVRSIVDSGAGPEDIAAEAQRWRLPVLPYRSEPWTGEPLPFSADPDSAAALHDGHLRGRLVVDLTALWAGPLATKKLAEAGATVVKIDPHCRPDGFRAQPNLYSELNGDKDIVDLDLRLDRDRERFEQLVADADLLVDSFSRRVLPNFGYRRRDLSSLNPRLATLSIVAFPLGCPEQDWLAYGTGIHAVAGFGLVQGRASAAPVAYPDVLAGYAAFVRSLEIIDTAEHAEVTLIGAAAAVHRAQG